MVLLRKLFKHEFVDCNNLFGEFFILLETLRHESDLTNCIEIWYHHSNWSEQIGQVVRKFRSTSVTRIHGNKETRVFRNSKCPFVYITLLPISLLNAVKDCLDLRGDD
jgi:hypothetical protein